MKDYPKREELYEHLDLFGKTLSDKFDKKLEENAAKYPIKTFYGVNMKYSEVSKRGFGTILVKNSEVNKNVALH